jgi:hypothetical protein
MASAMDEAVVIGTVHKQQEKEMVRWVVLLSFDIQLVYFVCCKMAGCGVDTEVTM